MRGFIAAAIMVQLSLGASGQAPRKVRPPIACWTEVEYLDLISGRYGVDREPEFAAAGCASASTLTSRRQNRVR